MKLPFARRGPKPEIPTPDSMIDVETVVAANFPQTFQSARRAAELVDVATSGGDFSSLARHSPGLERFDWPAYLKCSAVRMANAVDALREAGGRTGLVLDYGSYFGNMALFCRDVGYDVTAVDGYRGYGSIFRRCVDLMVNAGVRVVDFADVGADLHTIPDGTFNAVFALGVLEHVPHTPRALLQTLDRVLMPGGVLVIDTPNLAYLYNRERLAAGESIFTPIEQQFFTEVPFEGHHREYTCREVRWMIERLGHETIHIRTFNYSVFGLGKISGADAERYRRMEADPELREIILATSRKPAG